MRSRNDYLREVQKFATSQYWNSGLRITAGVMLPLFVLLYMDWLTPAIPFLWGALFVSLTDTPGPVHHRRNGMIAAILLNAVVVFITGWTRDYQILLVAQIVIVGFLLSMAGIYGARAGAVGLLALIVMLLNLLSADLQQSAAVTSVLIAAGGMWYMVFSLILYRIKPYRLVEQGLGEHLIVMASYLRARASFYKDGADLRACFTRVMEEQSEVKAIQDQMQELLFKTRKIVTDASPKSRSMMMIYLDSLDLFEEMLYAYQDYDSLHKNLGDTGLLTRFYGVVLQLAAGLEYIGLSVQRGVPVRRDIDLAALMGDLHDHLRSGLNGEPASALRDSLQALEKTLRSIRNIENRINKLVLYTRLELDNHAPYPDVAEQVSRQAATQPVTLKLFIENLTFRSNTFRHAARLTIAMLVAYGTSVVFSLTHPYWVLLTIVTILKPAYALTRKRNIARVAGTLAGVAVVSLLLYFISNAAALLTILVVSMLIGYSLLRVNYFGFVVFVTIVVIISFHFLNPSGFKLLIWERLLDTVIGSVIAFLASRFIFPVWEREEIRDSMEKMLAANRVYFSSAWKALHSEKRATDEYELARRDAVVALTNLSDNFQRMLDEPEQHAQSTPIHQFVIASHMLTGHIAALATEKIGPAPGNKDDLSRMASGIERTLLHAGMQLSGQPLPDGGTESDAPLTTGQNHLSIIHNLAYDILKITHRVRPL